jgi:hydrogenase nickel incorporation protein HypB
MPLRLVEVQQSILRKNTTLALELRQRFGREGTYVLNLLSSPGAGKTTLLEATLRRLGERYRVAALVGDQATDNDALRLARAGAPIRQITTGAECRLDAQMVTEALRDALEEQREGWSDLDALAIENVGNLICPAEYDLGEDLRAVVYSVTEGEDKPLKYPLAFATAHLAVISKIDLAQAVRFEREMARENIERVHPGLPVIELSALSGYGMEEWLEFLDGRIASKRALV